MVENNRVNLIICCLSSAQGGIDLVVSNLVNLLDKRKFQITLLCRKDLGLIENIDNFANIRLITFPKLERGIKRIKDIYILIRLVYLFTENKFVVCNPHEYYSLYFAMLAMPFGRKRVLMIPSVHQLPASLPVKLWKQRIFSIIDKVLLKRTNHIIAISENLKKELMQYQLHPAQITVVRNGIDVTDSLPSKDQRQKARGLLTIQENQQVIGYAGRLSPEKGPDVLVKAFAKVEANCRLIIAGDGPMSESLIRLTESLGLTSKIEFLGQMDDITPFYHAIDVLVQPSRVEGISMTILEAMNMGIPVIATNIGGNPEVIIDKVTGWLVSADDESGLSQAINDALLDNTLREMYGSAAKHQIMQKFNINDMISQTSKIFLSEMNKFR